jgi:hypothetical protein
MRRREAAEERGPSDDMVWYCVDGFREGAACYSTRLALDAISFNQFPQRYFGFSVESMEALEAEEWRKGG